jgi:hypothetical protein
LFFVPTIPPRLLSLFVFVLTFPAVAHVTPAAGENPQAEKVYALGSILKFGAGGEAEKFKASGWSSAEKEFTWTEGKGAKLSFTLPQNESALRLRMKLVGLIRPPEVNYQPVEVYVNGQKIADWQVAAPANFTATIPQKIAAGKQLEIELRTPKSTTPKALKMNNNLRVLGVGCFEMEITKDNEYDKH